jgi:hypothetical protein
LNRFYSNKKGSAADDSYPTILRNSFKIKIDKRERLQFISGHPEPSNGWLTILVSQSLGYVTTDVK